jgi:hypothetical protein
MNCNALHLRPQLQTKSAVQVGVERGNDGIGIVALILIEQAVPDERVDLAIPNFDGQAAEAATTTLSMQPHTLGRCFPDGRNTCHSVIGRARASRNGNEYPPLALSTILPQAGESGTSCRSALRQIERLPRARTSFADRKVFGITSYAGGGAAKPSLMPP